MSNMFSAFKEWYVKGNVKYIVRKPYSRPLTVWQYDPATNWWYVVKDEKTVDAVISLVDFSKS